MTIDQKPPKWMHPGIKPLNLGDRIFRILPHMINHVYGV